MRNNTGYIITLRDAAVDDELLKDLISSKYYLKSRKFPLLLYKDKEQFDKIDTAVCPAFRMHGFFILNFNKNDEDMLINFVKTRLSNDDFIKQDLNEGEIVDVEESSFMAMEELINEVNDILELNIKEDDIFKISEIKIKEEKMDIEKVVPSTVKASLNYLLIKNGKVAKSNNISRAGNEVRDFAIASHLSAILLNKFLGNHLDLQGQKVANVTMHDKSNDKIILLKQLEDNYNLVFECSKSEVDDAKQSIKDLDEKIVKGRTVK
jgi:hypothetical protein